MSYRAHREKKTRTHTIQSFATARPVKIQVFFYFVTQSSSLASLSRMLPKLMEIRSENGSDERACIGQHDRMKAGLGDKRRAVPTSLLPYCIISIMSCCCCCSGAVSAAWDGWLWRPTNDTQIHLSINWYGEPVTNKLFVRFTTCCDSQPICWRFCNRSCLPRNDRHPDLVQRPVWRRYSTRCWPLRVDFCSSWTSSTTTASWRATSPSASRSAKSASSSRTCCARSRRRSLASSARWPTPAAGSTTACASSRPQSSKLCSISIRWASSTSSTTARCPAVPCWSWATVASGPCRCGSSSSRRPVTCPPGRSGRASRLWWRRRQTSAAAARWRWWRMRRRSDCVCETGTSSRSRRRSAVLDCGHAVPRTGLSRRRQQPQSPNYRRYRRGQAPRWSPTSSPRDSNCCRRTVRTQLPPDSETNRRLPTAMLGLSLSIRFVCCCFQCFNNAVWTTGRTQGLLEVPFNSQMSPT